MYIKSKAMNAGYKFIFIILLITGILLTGGIEADTFNLNMFFYYIVLSNILVLVTMIYSFSKVMS